MTKVAALLRGVNVGGAGKLPMADLKRVLADLGYDDATTLLASGNAVFAAEAADGALEARIEAALAKDLGLTTEVMARSGDELARLVKANPFPKMAEADPGHLLAVFLKGEPRAADVTALAAKIPGDEAIEAGERCLYVCYPDGVGTSKLTGAMIEKAVGLRGTGRNWNTVLKLRDLTRAD